MEIIKIDKINILDRKTMVTVGMFDGVHIGHRRLIAHLLEQSERDGLSPVVVTFDRHPRQVLKPGDPLPLLSTYDERMSLLEECGVPMVALVQFDKATASLSACEFTSRYLCDKLNMNRLLLGYDNMYGSRAVDDFDKLPLLAKERGFEISCDEAVYYEGVDVSSTKIRRALSEGNMERANGMLGTPYGVTGVVVHGRHVGSTMGFPTANIMPSEHDKMLPAAGVYALRVIVEGRCFSGMANLGAQPTFNESRPVLEVHIIDFSGDLYGKTLRVEFLRRIRDIKTFASSADLAAQLAVDREEVIKIKTDI